MDNKYKIIIVGAIALVCFSLYSFMKPSSGLGGAFTDRGFSTTASSSMMRIDTTSRQIVATSSKRQLVEITNFGGSPVILNLERDQGVDVLGIVDETDKQGSIILIASTSLAKYTIDVDNLYTGAIQAITLSGGAKILVTESEF